MGRAWLETEKLCFVQITHLLIDTMSPSRKKSDFVKKNLPTIYAVYTAQEDLGEVLFFWKPNDKFRQEVRGLKYKIIMKRNL